jgi:hypothetical protein
MGIWTFNWLPCSYFWFFKEVILLKVVHPLKICWHIKSNGPTFSGASFAATSDVWKSTITIFKSSVKENNGSNKLIRMFTIFHCTTLHLFKWNSSWIVSIKQNVNFKFQLPNMFIFVRFCKSGPVKSCSSSQDLWACNILWCHINWFKFWIHLRGVKV